MPANGWTYFLAAAPSSQIHIISVEEIVIPNEVRDLHFVCQASLIPQRHHRIDSHRPPRRNVTRDRRNPN